jgi:hypothetical protein
MITATLPLSPSLPVAINPADFNLDAHPAKPPCLSAAAPLPASTNDANRADALLAHLQCSEPHVGSLSLFKTPTLYFHPLTDSFCKNRVGVGMPDHPITSRGISSQKGRKPRTAWGEAIRGLGVDFEDWALRNSLNFQWVLYLLRHLLAGCAVRSAGRATARQRSRKH